MRPELLSMVCRFAFTAFGIMLNDLPPGLEAKLPPTDARFRPDMRALELGKNSEVHLKCWYYAGCMPYRRVSVRSATEHAAYGRMTACAEPSTLQSHCGDVRSCGQLQKQHSYGETSKMESIAFCQSVCVMHKMSI